MRRALLSAALLAAAACATAKRGEPLQEDRQPQSEAERRGQVVYMARCYECHQNGEGGFAPAFNNKPLPREAIHFQIRHGVGEMPAFPETELSDADLAAVVDYVKLLRKDAPPK